jgi:hypothetical protein
MTAANYKDRTKKPPKIWRGSGGFGEGCHTLLASISKGFTLTGMLPPVPVARGAGQRYHACSLRMKWAGTRSFLDPGRKDGANIEAVV